LVELIKAAPTSLPDFITKIERLQGKAGTPLWFRGASKRTDELVPGLYRHKVRKKREEFIDLEHALMTRFRQRSIPYHTRDLRDDWEALFFMQHHGVPTRLLDWTENPFTALHFALMTAKRERTASGQMRYPGAACVWVLDPFAWNSAALSRISYAGGPLAPGDADLEGYLANSPTATLSPLPVAMYGAHNSPRIVAQQGVFTIFGEERRPMESMVRDGTIPARALTMMTFSASKIDALRTSLLGHGITESTIYPDLEGLAREMKRSFGFQT
jgi:hypothetical protein